MPDAEIRHPFVGGDDAGLIDFQAAQHHPVELQVPVAPAERTARIGHATEIGAGDGASQFVAIVGRSSAIDVH